jgi:hypothetical protein
MNFHIHRHNKPIISDYVSFNTRDVVWECRCGHRKLVREFRAYGSSFSLSWTVGLDKKEMEQVLNKTESESLLIFLDISKRAHQEVFGS